MSRRYSRALICASMCSVLHLAPAVAHDAAEPLRACMREPDDARRLACYDREMARLPSTTREESPPAAIPELTAEEQFGLSEDEVRKRRNAEEAPKLERLTATVTKIGQRRHGELVMTLDNGQVWAQKEPGPFAVSVGDAVTIRRAALGSFLMSTAAGRSTRVTRLP